MTGIALDNAHRNGSAIGVVGHEEVDVVIDIALDHGVEKVHGVVDDDTVTVSGKGHNAVLLKGLERQGVEEVGKHVAGMGCTACLPWNEEYAIYTNGDRLIKIVSTTELYATCIIQDSEAIQGLALLLNGDRVHGFRHVLRTHASLHEVGVFLEG